MKIKLTKKWVYTFSRSVSKAEWHDICLSCRPDWCQCQYFRGSAYLGTSYKLEGPMRKTIRQARRDAERLAVNLILDIRDGAIELYNMHCGDTKMTRE